MPGRIPLDVWNAITTHTVTQVARDLGISRNSVYRWRELPGGIPPHRAIELAGVLGLDRSDIRPDLWG